MNKIKIDREVKEDNVLYLDSNITLNIKNNINLFIVIEKNIDIDFNIYNSCNINIFSISKSGNINLNLNKENIELNYFYSSINNKNTKVKVNIYHNKNNISSYVKNHGLNLKNKLIFSVNTYIGKKILSSSCNQDSIIITDNNKTSSIKPNMVIDNNDIDANHSAYIGNFKDKDIFYLMSRGISLDDCKKILSKAFLVNDNINEEERKFIYKNLNENWR